ncbi:hypothetical protein FRC17_009542 [Serendipita sp. 399]|nr:hypothetical protein FRC17_009542 [Serendipita sp. 399]
MAPSGAAVILKYTTISSPEYGILTHLKKKGGPANHIIELTTVLDLSIGCMLVLPQMTPLPQALYFLNSSSALILLQHQFSQGVAFIHRSHIAHLDLKPDNMVTNGMNSLNSVHLYIINFDSAMEADLGTMIMARHGTLGWIAPEVTTGKSYSPILADRWSCGKVMEYIGQQLAGPLPMSALLLRLMKTNPSERPEVALVHQLKPLTYCPQGAWNPSHLGLGMFRGNSSLQMSTHLVAQAV